MWIDYATGRTGWDRASLAADINPAYRVDLNNDIVTIRDSGGRPLYQFYGGSQSREATGNRTEQDVMTHEDFERLSTGSLWMKSQKEKDEEAAWELLCRVGQRIKIEAESGETHGQVGSDTVGDSLAGFLAGFKVNKE